MNLISSWSYSSSWRLSMTRNLKFSALPVFYAVLTFDFELLLSYYTQNIQYVYEQCVLCVLFSSELICMSSWGCRITETRYRRRSSRKQEVKRRCSVLTCPSSSSETSRTSRSDNSTSWCWSPPNLTGSSMSRRRARQNEEQNEPMFRFVCEH